jgi:hypothetical protein
MILLAGTELSNSWSSKHFHLFIGIRSLQHPSREDIKVTGILYETDGDRFIPGSKRLEGDYGGSVRRFARAS